MPTREETAHRFADAMGFDLLMPWGFGWDVTPRRRIEFQLPSASAALSSHLYFVGRVAEALGLSPCVSVNDEHDGQTYVAFSTLDGSDDWPARASDPSWAAMLAAIAAKESKS